MNNRLEVMLAMCRWPICSCMKFMVERYFHHTKLCVKSMIMNEAKQLHLIDQMWIWSFGPYLNWYLGKQKFQTKCMLFYLWAEENKNKGIEASHVCRKWFLIIEILDLNWLGFWSHNSHSWRTIYMIVF